ncbi:MAG: hypothetical protein HY252_07285 [Sphingobacteriales bacterium]|nr:hypothetical protein [Sphingobacteriales bacterium]
MNNNPASEANKNTKALVTTLVFHGLLLLMFFLIAFKEPVPPVYPPPGEGVEVNLGNSDQGFGDEQPLVKGEPAPAAEEQVSSPPPTAQPETVKEETPDNENGDEEVKKKPVVTKPTTKPKPVVNNEPPKKNPAPTTVTNPIPAPPKPKATYKGGTGTGGNNADDYNKSRNQGIAGGKGDQGKPNGNPNSDSYTGNGGTGKSGISVGGNLKGRGHTNPSFEDDFNENAKVVMQVMVSADGRVTSASYVAKGSTTSNASMIEIARRKAFQIKFAAGEEATGTITFNFKLRG